MIRIYGGVCLLLATLTVAVAPARADELTLEQAITQAVAASPVLGASAAREQAASANREQAAAFQNPELSIEAENIYGDYDGLDEGEITYGISQRLELAGKRTGRIGVAEAQRLKSHYARDAARLDLIRDIRLAYAETWASQQNVAILEEEYKLATEVRDSVAARVSAGKEPLIQKKKADIELAASQIALDQARRTLKARKQALSALMGGSLTEFTVRSSDAIAEPESLDIYRAGLLQTADLQSLEADINGARAEVSLEKANAVPDPTFSFGVRDIRGEDAQAFVAGVSFPFPVLNRNRAGIERATQDLNAVMLDQRGSHLSMEAQLARTHGELSNAYHEVTVLQSTVLPGAEEAFSFARQGYEAGKFGYLEVLDAQRTLFSTRKHLTAAVLEYQRQSALIARMTARHDDHHSDKGSQP